MGAIDVAALGPFKRQAHGLHGRENEKSLLYFGCDFSGWYNFGKIIKTVATRCHSAAASGPIWSQSGPDCTEHISRERS